MSRADATKARILKAATAEFSTHGIAGARVDRIAAAAGANKNLIYVYFGSKDGLFEAVFDAYVVQLLDEVPLTPDDLPGYAGRLFDFYCLHPELLRLATWHRLERTDGSSQPPAVAASNRNKVDALARARAGGRLDDTLSPSILLALILAIAAAWGSASPTVLPPYGDEDVSPAACRAAIVEATRRLLSRSGRRTDPAP
jgi:AcrR family transcriptional regulator